jgi:hypothetical protein
MVDRRYLTPPGSITVWLPLVGLIGCSAAELPPAGEEAHRIAHGGQRLDAIYQVADGAEQFQHFLDTGLGIPCEFAPRAPGSRSWRCIPREQVRVVYVDRACTQPVAMIPSNSAGPSPVDGSLVAAADGPGACPDGRTPARAAYRVGEPIFTGGDITMPLPAVYEKMGSTCQTTSVALRFPPSLLRLNPEDDDRFVAASLLDLSAGGGLGIQRLYAAEGSELTVGVLGRDGVPCAIQPDGVCLPLRAARPISGSLAEADCQVELDGAMDLPRAELIQTGTGALRLARFVAPLFGGRSKPVALDRGETFTDTAGGPCVVWPTVGGDHRCLPQTRWELAEGGLWSDAACQQRLLDAYPMPTAADPIDLSELQHIVFEGAARQLLKGLFSVVEYWGPTYRIQPGTPDCAPYQVSPDTPSFAPATAIPLSSLPGIEVVVF